MFARNALRGLALVALAGCAAEPPRVAAPNEKVTPQLRSGSSEARTYLVEDWIAPDDRTLVVNAVDRSLFAARFRHQCPGLRLVNSVAFIVPTPPQVEKYQGVVLPNGTRCPFSSLTRLEVPSPPAAKDGLATEHP